MRGYSGCGKSGYTKAPTRAKISAAKPTAKPPKSATPVSHNKPQQTTPGTTVNEPPEMGATTGGTGPPPTQIEALRGLLNGLVALVPTGSQGTARGLAKEIQALFTALEKKDRLVENPEALTVTHLQRVVTEAVRAAISPSKGAPQARSWATVASGGPVPTQLSQPTKTIPQRINREILVRGADMPADLAKRTPAEIIQVINQASAKKGAIVARKLPSGDIVVTFSDPTTKEWHNQNNQWIQQAFGDQAKEACRTFAVLVKGLKRADL